MIGNRFMIIKKNYISILHIKLANLKLIKGRVEWGEMSKGYAYDYIVKRNFIIDLYTSNLIYLNIILIKLYCF